VALNGLRLHEKAIQKFQRATELKRDFYQAYGWWGQSLGELDRVREAIGKYERAIEINPRCDWIFMAWGELLDKFGRHDEASKKYETAIAIDSRNAMFLNVRRSSLKDFPLSCLAPNPLRRGALEMEILDRQRSRRLSRLNPGAACAKSNNDA
jgi:tetratricopeptide (TPR) repeat protein